MHPAFTLALALAVSVLAQSAARHLRLPGIVLLLGAGLGLGPDGLGWVQPRDLGDGLYAIVDVAVSVILFEGGLNLEMSKLRRQQAPIRRLVTLGALVTLCGGAAAAHWLLAWPWPSAILFGSLVVVTGPTVIGPLIAELRLRSRVATVLEAEGVLIDPIGAILAVLALEVAVSPNVDSLAAGGLGLVMRLGFGALAGVAAGILLAGLLRIRRLVPEGHENILVLAVVLLLFQACEVLVAHSGIVAVTVAGVAVGNLRTLVDRDLREFKDQLSVMLIGLLFVMLAADVRIAEVRSLGSGGLWVVAALILVVRPLGVMLATRGSELSLRERGFIAWVAPRGIVAAAIASIVAGTLQSEGIAGGLELRALVFLTIGCTVVLAGLTAGPVGSFLGVRLPGRDGIAILGANALSVALARALGEGKRPIVFLDTNPQSCRAVEEQGFGVVFGDAMLERTMQRARFESVATSISVTGNSTLNGAFVRRARENFGVSKGLVALRQAAAGQADEMVSSGKAEVLFEGYHDVERWDVRFRRGDVQVVRRRYRDAGRGTTDSAGADKLDPGERFIILAIHRGERSHPMSMRFRLEKGDEASVAIHVPEQEEAFRILRSMGWWEIPQMVQPDQVEKSASDRTGSAS